MHSNITSCCLCDCYYTHWGVEQLDGGVRMKSGVSYCRFNPKYRKLSQTECFKAIGAKCPRRLKEAVLGVYRKDDNPYDGIIGRPAAFVKYEFLRAYKVPCHTADSLMGSLVGHGVRADIALEFGDVFTLYDGLCRQAYLYFGDSEYRLLKTAFLSNKTISVKKRRNRNLKGAPLC